MEFSKLIFPAPLSSYTVLDPDLVWIPIIKERSFMHKIFSKNKDSKLIPAFFIPYLTLDRSCGSPNILVYFHANGEDLGIAYEFLINLQNTLKINILATEYPGYGVYNGKASEKAVL